MTAENQLIEKLNEVGDRLLQPPSSTPELLELLDEARAALVKVGQKPSESVREVLLLPMKALIADELLENSDPGVKITVASCLNEIMRISAPVAPYDDAQMKEIFGLIVSSFDNLLNPHGPLYSKAVLILENVAKLRSCVMMLDLECDPLITKMFDLFLKSISSEHPRLVLLAMEAIMSVMIKESDTVPQELLKVLLASIRKENKDISPVSWELGAKIIEECSEKLKPHVLETVVSMGSTLYDYAPILSSICKDELDDLKNPDDASADDVVNSKPSANMIHSAEFVQALGAECSSKKTVAGTDDKAIDDEGSNSGSSASKKERKQSVHNHNGAKENSFGKGKASLGNLSRSNLTEKVTDLEHKHVHQDTPPGDRSKKKGGQLSSIASGGGSRNIENATVSSRKEKAQTSDSSNSKSQRKRASSDDDVIETPYGRKSYKEDLVGCRIKVWWPLDRRYYEGIISSYDTSTKKHKVDYDDGDEEILNLMKESWELTGDEISPAIDLVVDKRKREGPSNRPPRQGSTEDDETSAAHSEEKKGATPEPGPKSSNGTQAQAHGATKTLEKSSEGRSPNAQNS